MEKMMKRQELEKRALQVVERLLEDSVSEEFLADCARFITAANYRDAVEERSIVKLCGYPVCPNKLGKIPTQLYKISTKTNKVYDMTELKCFCSNFCYKASKEFEQQISKTPLWLRQHESGSSGEEVCPAERHLQEDDIENPLAAELEDSQVCDPCSAATQQQGTVVHWVDLLKCISEDRKGDCALKKKRKKQIKEGDEEKLLHQKSQKTEEEEKIRQTELFTCGTEFGTYAEKPKQHRLNTNCHSGEQAPKRKRELDEDDLEDDRTEEDREWDDAEEQKRSSPVVPDHKRLRRETQPLELRVSDFYRETWVLPEKKEKLNGDKLTVQDQNTKDQCLPHVDSNAQQLSQKRIIADKLSSCREGPTLPRVQCPYHSETLLVEDYTAGDMICPECGLVVGDRVIDVSSEWRTFSNETELKDPSRVGDAQNPLLNGRDLTTMISKGTGAASFDEFGNSKYQNRWTMSSSDRTIMKAFDEISTMADRINLPRNIIDRTNYLFKQAYEQKSLKGRANDAIASACLYIACRQEGVPRTFKEICAVSRISKKEIGRCFKLILKAVETNVDVITTGDFMSRFCSKLGLPKQVQIVATFIARKAVELNLLPGRSPTSVAAAAIYMASQASAEKKTQKEIADIAGVADITIRQAYRLIYQHAAELFPPPFKFVDKLPLL